MGDPTPEVVDLKCQNCGTEFRLRPTKGRMPKGPVKCPECSAQIQVPEFDTGTSAATAPKAAVLRTKRASDSSAEMDDLAAAMRDVPQGGTLIGAPIAIGFERDDTRVDTPIEGPATEEMKIPTEPPSADVPQSRQTKKMRPQPALNGDLDETSESVFNNTTRHPWESERNPQLPDANQESEPEEDETEDTHRRTRPNVAPNKPKLSDLLKKVRDKRGVHPTQPMAVIPPIPSRASTEDLFGGIQDVIDESVDDLGEAAARALKTKKLAPRSPDDSIDETIRDSIRGELGMAGERVGSGYIRIPTAEILDVLGSGSYRLRVQDVVYEPVDEKGLVRLIKGGVLMGAEYIAEADGDWMPINEHPVIQDLKSKMAEEAHRLLAEVAGSSPSSEEDVPLDDADDVFELEEMEESEGEHAPPPLPPAAEDKTIESGPPSTLPPADYEITPTLDFPSEGGLMNTSAVDEIAGAITPEHRGLFDGTSVVDEIASSVGSAPEPEPAVEPELGEPLSEPEAPADIDADFGAEEGLREPTADFEDEPFEKPKRSKAPIFLLLIVLIAGGGAAAYFSGALDSLIPVAPNDAPNNAKKPETPNSNNVVAQKPENAPDAGQDAAAATDPLEAAQTAFDTEATPENAKTLADLLVQAERSEDAIAVLEEAVTLEGGESLTEMLNTLKPKPAGPATLSAAELTAVEFMQIRKHKIFGAQWQGRKYLFVPDRKTSLKASRAVKAAHTLCQNIECGFAVPDVQDWSMPKSEWETFATANRIRISDLEWRKDGDSEVLHGVMQEELVEPIAWPMNRSQDWREYIDKRNEVNAPIDEALKSVEGVTAISDQLGTEGANKVGPGMASILTYDFLVNNFARFNEDLSPNVAAKHEGFVSVDNLDAFQTRASTRVKGRFSWVSHFNKAQVDSLRSISPDTLNDKLFPDPSRTEKVALRVFWKQRDAVIEAVDRQAKSKGEEGTFF